MNKSAMTLLILLSSLKLCCTPGKTLANQISKGLTTGERLTYELRWENIPAGKIQLQIRPITTINGEEAFHFVMIAQSNAAVDLFCKIRDRIDAYADIHMTHSVYYQKGEAGKRKRRETIEFNWQDHKAVYKDSGRASPPIDLKPGSFDPLSAFYFTRMMISEAAPRIARPVTNGKKNFHGKAEIIKREFITLKNGKTYDTFCIQPDTALFGGIFKDSPNAPLLIWITADDNRIPILIKTKVKVGYFIGELIKTEAGSG